MINKLKYLASVDDKVLLIVIPEHQQIATSVVDFYTETEMKIVNKEIVINKQPKIVANMEVGSIENK